MVVLLSTARLSEVQMLSLARKGILSGRQFQIIGASQNFQDNSLNNDWALPSPYSGFTFQAGDFLLVLVTSNIVLNPPTIPAVANWMVRVPQTGNNSSFVHYYGLVLQASDLTRGTVRFQSVHSAVMMFVIRGPKAIGFPKRANIGAGGATSYTMSALTKDPKASGIMASLLNTVTGSTTPNNPFFGNDGAGKGYVEPVNAIRTNVGSYDQLLKGAGKYPPGETLTWTNLSGGVTFGEWLEFFNNLTVGSIETVSSVPYMTSNSAPAGNKVGGNGFAQPSTDVWQAFDGNDATYLLNADDGGGSPITPMRFWRQWTSNPPIIGRVRFKWASNGPATAVNGVSLYGSQVPNDDSFTYSQFILSQTLSSPPANTWINIDIPRQDWNAWYGLQIAISTTWFTRITSIEFMVGTP